LIVEDEALVALELEVLLLDERLGGVRPMRRRR
jgi:hypothetical protein